MTLCLLKKICPLGLVLVSLFVTGCNSVPKPALDGSNDPYLWLEEVEGKKPLDWVGIQNKESTSTVRAYEGYNEMVPQALKILEDKNKIPKMSIRSGYLYNFWQDKVHVRGLWRRTKLSKFKKGISPKWETIIDVDALAKKEKENWIFKGAQCLPPKNDLCLVEVSRGGTDASVLREFQVSRKRFVKNGFKIKEAKSWVGWKSKDELFVATNFGEGSLTESGYPLEVKLWKRGTQLSKAPSLFKGNRKNMIIGASRIWDGDNSLDVLYQLLSFYSSKTWLLVGGKKIPIPKPDGANVYGFFKKHLLLELRQDWKVGEKNYKAGSLVAFPLGSLTQPNLNPETLIPVYTPPEGSSVLGMNRTKDRLLINVLSNVKGKILEIGYKNGFLPALDLVESQSKHVTLHTADSSGSTFFVNQEGFLQPKELSKFDFKNPGLKSLLELQEKFKSQGMAVRQEWTKSNDGTSVPYFVFGKESVLKKGKAPTLLYGYGGFEISRTPYYSGLVGKLWLERGGVYAIANIRGGGEFGPKWHQAALKTNRHKAYDDFIAVAEALIAKGITTSKNLGIYGRSNGGLLVGAIMTRRPDLFRAVVCGVPLLDMIRYSQLLAGASWMGEYGDPRKPEMYDYLASYSPYHNVDPKKKYPALLLMTSTKDDRVHPGHARKMAAKMKGQGHNNILYFENTEGGHKGSANLKQLAERTAMRYAFLFHWLK